MRRQCLFMEERLSDTRDITFGSLILKVISIKDCSLKGRPYKCVTIVVKYINDLTTYIDFCTAPTYIMQIYIYQRDL